MPEEKSKSYMPVVKSKIAKFSLYIFSLFCVLEQHKVWSEPLLVAWIFYKY